MTDVPRMLQIETSTRCNANCAFCPRSQMTRPAGDMEERLFRKIVDNAAALGINKALLFLNGEPLMFSRLFDYLAILRELGIKTDLFTNGKLMTQDMAAKVLAFSDVIEVICFSVPGIDEETYKELSGMSGYIETVRNVCGFWAMNAGRITTNVHTPLVASNVRYLDIWQRSWEAYSDAASPTDFYNFAGLVSDPLELREDATHEAAYCDRLLQLAVMWDGRCCLCCMDMNGEVILGDLCESSIEEVFNSALAVQYREAHSEGRFDELALCSKCNMKFQERKT